MSCGTKGVLIWENSHQCEFHAEMTSWFCIVFTCSHVFSMSHDQHDYVILNCPNYACTTCSSLLADQFHTETSGLSFTWYCCKILYLSEILFHRLQPGWTHAGVTWHFCGGIVQTNKEPWEPEWTSCQHRSSPGVMLTHPPKLLVHVLLTSNFFYFVDISLKPSSFLQWFRIFIIMVANVSFSVLHDW